MAIHDAAICIHDQELDSRIRVDAGNARQEILQMCEAMGTVRLPTSTTAEVRQCKMGFLVLSL